MEMNLKRKVQTLHVNHSKGNSTAQVFKKWTQYVLLLTGAQEQGC